MSDQAALDSLTFDIRWQHALDAKDAQSYLSRRSLVEFRRRLVEHDPEMALMRKVFERISAGAVAQMGLDINEQRVDSTLAVSNIRTAGLLELFRNTTRLFVSTLDNATFSTIPTPIHTWYAQRPDGWFGLGAGQRREKVQQIVGWIQTIVEQFATNQVVSQTEAYALLKRVFEEHCEVEDNDTTDHNEGSKPSNCESEEQCDAPQQTIVLRHRRGATLQSPYDPDAQYGHKGIGYKVHVTETCNNAKQTEIITDYEVHGNARSDMAKVEDVISRLDSIGLTPSCLYADAGYPTPQLLIEMAERNIELMAPIHRASLDDAVMSREDFSFGDEGRISCCPQGHPPIDHRVQNPNGEGRHLHAMFDGEICRRCPQLAICPVRAPNHRAKGCPHTQTVGNFRLDINPALRARDRRGVEQTSTAWKDRYKIRAGIAATMSELKRAHGLGKLRVRRLPRVHFAVVCKVTACNVKRWMRTSPLGRLTALCRAFFALTRPTAPIHSISQFRIAAFCL